MINYDRLTVEQPEDLLEEIEEIDDTKDHPYLELFRSVFFYKPPSEESMAVTLEKALEDFIFNKNNDALSDIYFLLCASLDGLAVLYRWLQKKSVSFNIMPLKEWLIFLILSNIIDIYCII
ncbi:hypothetical protein [Coxiella burnetii]|uniref:hypothetical protein n=1 Tax=Coxiella burnetii TaxID=777 RepID=UPI00050A082E|nr:hypothetical protein [Coxiella burnetii]ATN67313.1 hypothetical protein AYM17_08215 [Coxiella burnetii]OYK85497.1 hypothetical protein CbuQ229_08510 [Coxiella burnetii]